MALIILGLFVLVWIISAVVKASQDPGGRRTGPTPAQRERERDRSGEATPQRTSNSDIDRFMAEIDRLRRRGEGAPAGGRAPEQRPTSPSLAERPARTQARSDPRPRPLERRERERDRERERERERERRTRQSAPRSVPAPPPLPSSESVPVLRPVAPERPAPPAAPPPAPPRPPRPARPAAAAAVAAASDTTPSPVLQTLQSVIRSKTGPAAALILAEIFGEPRGAQMMRAQRPATDRPS
jgi:hypothetical protein